MAAAVIGGTSLFGGRGSGWWHPLCAGSIAAGKDIAAVVEVGQNHDRCSQSRGGAVDSQAHRLVDEILGCRGRQARAPPEPGQHQGECGDLGSEVEESESLSQDAHAALLQAF